MTNFLEPSTVSALHCSTIIARVNYLFFAAALVQTLTSTGNLPAWGQPVHLNRRPILYSLSWPSPVSSPE